MRILLALVALCRWSALLAQEPTTGTTQRSNTVKENLNFADKRLKFMNIIRDDLRRNNDDYALLEQQNQLAYPAPPAHPPQPPAHPPQPPAPRSLYRKRMLARGPRPKPPRRYYGDTRRGKGALDQSILDDNAFRSYTHSKNYKIERENKLKRLLNKDNVRVRETEQIEDTTINTLPETKPTFPPPAPHPRPPPHRTPGGGVLPSPPPTPALRTHFTPPRRDSPPPEDTQGEAPVLRQRMDRSQSLSPDQLDMAAARNPQIARIRYKGRLCQRSLMNLEGPTYDKGGKEVIPEHKARGVRGRQFHQTRAPDLVLPRCCNCCKKSVLGCQ